MAGLKAVAHSSGDGGTIGGSIAATQVAFGSGANTISGDSNFIYDGTFLSLASGKAFKGQYTNIAHSAYINPDGSAVFGTNSIFSNIGNLSVPAFKLTASPVNGYVLTSDASGNGSWQVGGSSTFSNDGNGNIYSFNSGVTLPVSGNGNFLAGENAGKDINGASYNQFIGDHAGEHCIGGSLNVGLGFRALEAGGNNGANVALGYNSGNNTIGSYNTFTGTYSGSGITSGTGNTVSGAFAKQSSDGNYVSSFGYEAGPSGGDYTTAFGRQSLYNATGSYITAYGAYSGHSVSSGGFGIFIGQHADSWDPTVDGLMNIGSVIFGKNLYTGGVDNSTPTLLGMIGMGTNDPQARLHLTAPTTVIPPPSFTATLMAESIGATPSDSLNLIYAPRDNGSDNGSVETTGSGYVNNDTVSAYVLSYRLISGTPFTSPSGFALTTINLSGNPAAIQWNWNATTNGDTGAPDGYIIVINDTTIGSTYSYDVGNTLSYYDDNVGGTVSYSLFNGINSVGQTMSYRTYLPYFSPSNANYYAQSSPYSITAASSGGDVFFWVSHTISGTSGQQWVEDEEVSSGGGFNFTYTAIGDGQYYETTPYTSSDVRTPNHYGFQAGVDLGARVYHAHNQQISPALYSNISADSSTPDPMDFNYYYFQYDFSSAIDGIKTLQSIDMATSTGLSTTGASGTFYQDVLGGAFAESNDVMPSAIFGTSLKVAGQTVVDSIQSLVVTPGYLAAWDSDAKLISTQNVGVVTGGVWNGTAIGVQYGGTGLTGASQGDIIYAGATNSYSLLAKNTTATRYLSNTGTSNNPSWAQINLANGVTGTLPVANGGTNIASYAVGDLLYASASTTLSKLADVATGNALISGGVTTAPSWGKIGLTTHVSGTLPVANGGIGATTFVGAGIVSVVTSVVATNQGADITSTNFANTSTAGLYRVSYSLEDTTADVTAGAVTLTIAYTAAAGAITIPSAALVLTGVGLTQGTIFAQLSSGSISYSTAHTGLFGTAKYALYCTVERLT